MFLIRPICQIMHQQYKKKFQLKSGVWLDRSDKSCVFLYFFLRLSSQIGQNNFLCLNWRIKQTNVEFFVPELKGLKKPRLTFSACLHIGQIKDFFLYFFCAWLDRPEKSAFLQQLLMLDLTELSNYLFFQKNLVPAWHTWQIKNILLITS